MYQLVSNVREGKPIINGEEVAVRNRAWAENKLKDKSEQASAKGWKIASADLRGSSSNASLQNT